MIRAVDRITLRKDSVPLGERCINVTVRLNFGGGVVVVVTDVAESVVKTTGVTSLPLLIAANTTFGTTSIGAVNVTTSILVGIATATAA